MPAASELDAAWLLWINQDWANAPLDVFFSTISSHAYFSLPIVLLTCFGWILLGKKWGLLLTLAFLLCLGTGDRFCYLLKITLEAPRPCQDLAHLVRPVPPTSPLPCGDAHRGMPSAHVFLWFSAAFFVSAFPVMRPWGMILYWVAFGVALSRVYLAKHYPSQIGVGFVLGILWGMGYAKLLTRYDLPEAKPAYWQIK